MKKLIVSSVFALSLMGATVASAQGTCVSISPTLQSGSRGVQVTALQNFLVSRNYPGGGNWMVTGYFGQATAAAVRIFQGERNLPQTGIVDSATASAVSSVSCGQGGYAYTPAYNQNYNYNQNYGNPFLPNNNPVYPYNYNYPFYQYGTTPVITSLSQNTGMPGNTVTVYGSGFDAASNTVYFGSQPLYNIPSQNGTSLVFTVPSYFATSNSLTGTSLKIYVSDSRGTSNSVDFTIYGGYYGCGTYPYNTYPFNSQCGGCTWGPYGYNSCQPSNPNAISAQYLSPQQGGVGTTVTIYGSGFTTTGNTVHFGSGIMTNLNSPDGRSVSFTVPAQLTGFGTQVVTVGTYAISVTNSLGLTSQTLPFNVTSVGSPAGAPVIASVNGPSSLPVGSQGTWTLQLTNTNNSYVNVSVNWGDSNGYAQNATAQNYFPNGSQSLTFTHTYYTAGTYTVIFTVSNQAGESNTSTMTVSVGSGGTTSAPAISYILPTSGRIGTQVTVTGSGFSLYGNTVHFGIGGVQNVPSYNGTTLSFIVPNTLSPCDVLTAGQYCAQYQQFVTPGAYNVSVTNGSGTSNVFTFTVTY